MVKKNLQDKSLPHVAYPPVVAVLGHVDHGKTSLLDAIRKTNVASREHGGITQKIGASSVEITVEGVRKHITFIDTPGHEAFTHMRGRGTQAADIGLLVISLVDGVMPQTEESIKILKKAQIPFIVVLTKADVPENQEEKTKRQLAKEEVLLEGYGGDVPYISVSSKTNTNIKELLELIILVFDMKQKPVLDNNLKGIIIESQLDQKSGPRATVVVKSGTLSVRDEIECDGIKARVRTIINDKGVHLDKVTVGEAVEVLGFEKVPMIGGIVTSSKSKVQSPKLVESSSSVAPVMPFRSGQEAMPMPEDFLNAKEVPTLSIVLCADNQGSLEAIVKSLPKEINIALAKTGDITTTDILLAKSINAIVLGFNTKMRPEIVKFAAQEKILTKSYKIIYELISEIKDVLEGKQLALVEEIFGRAKILASFPFEKTKVLGIKVLEGRVARGDKIRLIRKEEIVGESTINSVRVGKNIVSKVEQNQEGGIIISPFLDFTIGDMLICHG
ncbi:MAG: GTP-binding protein [Candidatus Levybacteria bacterium]|nr:GTP-binding protein [Candidatus Levybacteria bacterium]MDZ4228295.1 GTP-binding protein [Candidatus Levybacteria bacterium]